MDRCWRVDLLQVDDWWKTYGYLAGRDSLVYSNTGGVDTIFNAKTSKQAARTANLLCLWDRWFDDVAHKPDKQPVDSIRSSMTSRSDHPRRHSAVQRAVFGSGAAHASRAS